MNWAKQITISKYGLLMRPNFLEISMTNLGQFRKLFSALSSIWKFSIYTIYIANKTNMGMHSHSKFSIQFISEGSTHFPIKKVPSNLWTEH